MKNMCDRLWEGHPALGGGDEILVMVVMTVIMMVMMVLLQSTEQACISVFSLVTLFSKSGVASSGDRKGGFSKWQDVRRQRFSNGLPSSLFTVYSDLFLRLFRVGKV